MNKRNNILNAAGTFLILAGILISMELFSMKDYSITYIQNTVIMSQEQDTIKPIIKSEETWKDELSGMEFKVLRNKGTERAFSGEYWDHFEDGSYVCKACGLELFDSETKFDAHCGWPSFYEAIESKNIKTADDFLLGYKRTELMCARCDGHLGHVFEDGPAPTGLRYCINSVSIDFKKESDK